MTNNGIVLRVGYVEPRDVLVGCRLGFVGLQVNKITVW